MIALLIAKENQPAFDPGVIPEGISLEEWIHSRFELRAFEDQSAADLLTESLPEDRYWAAFDIA